MTPRRPWRRRNEFATLITLLASIIATFTILAVAIAHGAPPETPQQDGRFLFTLGEAGIVYGDATQVIVAGHEVCSLLDAGGSLELAVETLDRNTQLGRKGATVFAAISIQVFCGRHGDALRPHRGGSGTRVLGTLA